MHAPSLGGEWLEFSLVTGLSMTHRGGRRKESLDYDFTAAAGLKCQLTHFRDPIEERISKDVEESCSDSLFIYNAAMGGSPFIGWKSSGPALASDSDTIFIFFVPLSTIHGISTNNS